MQAATVAEYRPMWLQSLKALFGTTSRSSKQDSHLWDKWWNDEISRGHTRGFLFPIIEAPMIEYHGTYIDVVNSDDLLIAIMGKCGFKSVLCAGNGLSQEPRALAGAGFDVTALDISPKAVAFAKAYESGSCPGFPFCSPELQRGDGRVEFVVGDLLDTSVCPGPFDVIIERRTIQRFREEDRPTALQALTGRLDKVGIFLSQCNDASYPSKDKLHFHAAESWLRQHSWEIWDGTPSATLSGRVAWLLRSSG